MKANQALGLCELGFDLSRVWSWETESVGLVGLALDLCKELDLSCRQDLEGEPGVGSCQDSETMRVLTARG